MAQLLTYFTGRGFPVPCVEKDSVAASVSTMTRAEGEEVTLGF